MLVTNAHFLVSGTKEPPARSVLQAGPVRALFEHNSGILRRITWHGLDEGAREVVRGVGGAVRDRNWGTVTPQIVGLKVDQHEAGFTVRFTAECQTGEISFVWQGRITGDAEGTILYEFDGVAGTTFFRNRIGLYVLHPLRGCAGEPCELETVDGTRIQATFPRLIAPHQPFMNLRAIRQQIAPGVSVEVRMEGETFEMEDQRNWTDASFKTYGTPLGLPFPVEIKPGTRVQQTITIRFKGDSTKTLHVLETPASSETVISLEPGEAGKRPSLGFCIPETDAEPTARQQELLRELQPDHLRTEVRFDREHWKDALAAASHLARNIGTSLHLALHFTGNAIREMSELQQMAPELECPVSLLLAFQTGQKSTPPRLLEQLLPWAGQCFPKIPVAAGTDAYFAELNRERPPANSPTLPCFSISPHIHAFDNLSFMETLEAQEHAIESVSQFSQNPVVVSPITLRPRWNPNATGPDPSLAPGELPPRVDLRQMTLFGAAWTLGSLARLLVHPQIHSLTYYETVGWRGLMESETGSQLPARFPSLPCELFPLYHVFHDLAGTRPDQVCRTSDPDTIAALWLARDNGQQRLLLANLTPERQRVRFPLPGGRAKFRVLHGENLARWRSLEPRSRLNQGWEDLLTNTLTLPAYACARIDLIPQV